MKSNFTYRIILLTLAFLMFFSSVSISRDAHWCQGKERAVSYVGKAHSCKSMDKVPANCEMGDQSQSQINKIPCCHNETSLSQLDVDYETPGQSDLSTQNVQFLVAYSYNYILKRSISFPNDALVSGDQYQNPIIPRDIYVLLETYII